MIERVAQMAKSLLAYLRCKAKVHATLFAELCRYCQMIISALILQEINDIDLMLIAEQMTFEEILSRIHYNRVYNYTEQLAVINQLDHFLTQHPNVIIAQPNCHAYALLKQKHLFICVLRKPDQVGRHRLYQLFIPCRLYQLSHALT